MMSVIQYKVGDLVWAKIKGLPHWPAKVCPQDGKTPPSQKELYYRVQLFCKKGVFWVREKDLAPHCDIMVQCARQRKTLDKEFRRAVEIIVHFSEEISNTSTNIRSSRNQLCTKNEVKNTEVLEPYIKAKNGFKMDDTCALSHKSINCEVQKDTKRVDYTPANKIGVLGLGEIGQIIVKKLLSRGCNIMVWTDVHEKCNFSRVTQAKNPADLVSECDIILSCLQDPDNIMKIIFGKLGVLEGFGSCRNSGKGFIEMSVINPEVCKTVCKGITSRGGRYVEAILCGSIADCSSSVFIGAGDSTLIKDAAMCFDILSELFIYLTSDVGMASKVVILIGALHILYSPIRHVIRFVTSTKLPKKHVFNIIDCLKLNYHVFAEKAEAIFKEYVSYDTCPKHLEVEAVIKFIFSFRDPLSFMILVDKFYKTALGFEDE